MTQRSSGFGDTITAEDKWDIRVHPDGKFLMVGAWVGKDKHRRYYTCPGGGCA